MNASGLGYNALVGFPSPKLRGSWWLSPDLISPISLHLAVELPPRDICREGVYIE